IDALVQLKVAQPISADRLRHRCDKWEARHEMWSDHQSFVHGDATPTNFIFGPDEETLTAIDFERLHVSDAMYDIGLFAAELKHHFALRIHNAAAAEPFIKCFLEHYFQATDKQEESYSDFTFRNRFYMALGELRIARNPWLPFGHREWLIHEAGRCLET
ncbi:MAG: phosphotransferase, partial [Acidobacteriota bacterium]